MSPSTTSDVSAVVDLDSYNGQSLKLQRCGSTVSCFCYLFCSFLGGQGETCCLFFCLGREQRPWTVNFLAHSLSGKAKVYVFFGQSTQEGSMGRGDF